MTLDQLTNLVSIVEVGSFKAASEALFKTQPTLSASIKNLEEELGVKIFSREKYRPELTNAGIALYEKAKGVLSEAKSFLDLGQSLASGSEAIVRVGMDIVSPRSSTLQLLREYFAEKKDTKLQLNLGVLTSVMDEVKKGDLDIGITPLFRADAEIDAQPFFRKLKMLPVCTPELFGKNKIIVKDLKLKPQIILKNPETGSSNISAGILEGGIHWHTYHNEVKQDLILSGLGWGSLPEHAIKKDIEKGLLKVINNEQIKPTSYKVFIIKKHGRDLGPVAQGLWDKLGNLH